MGEAVGARDVIEYIVLLRLAGKNDDLEALRRYLDGEPPRDVCRKRKIDRRRLKSMKEAILTKMGSGKSFLAFYLARKTIEAIERVGVKPKVYPTKYGKYGKYRCATCRKLTKYPEQHIMIKHLDELKKETERVITKIKNMRRTQKFLGLIASEDPERKDI
jgi:hypothetical protein